MSMGFAILPYNGIMTYCRY